MAQTSSISTKELKRVAQLSYEGKTLKVMLCLVANNYTEESTIANWQTTEISGNGYARFSAVIGTGSYDNTTGSYLLPDIDAEFIASGSGYMYDRVVLYIDNELYPHSVIVENPNIALVDGQTQTYRITLSSDN